MKDDELKIFDERDFSGILSAALSDIESNSGGGQIDEIRAKELAQWDIVEFTDEEIKAMPKTFRKLILIQKKRCRLRTRKSGKDGTTYEIRYRSDGYDVHACGKTIDIAKANFIEKLKTAQPIQRKTGENLEIPATFTAFSLYHFENFKKEKVSPKHYENSLYLFKRYLSPRFKETPLIKITPSDCKTIIDEVKGQGKGKTADDLHSILNGIFKGAIAHGIITQNPLAVVVHTQHERESGEAITKADEIRLFTALNGSNYAVAAALVCFVGYARMSLKRLKFKVIS